MATRRLSVLFCFLVVLYVTGTLAKEHKHDDENVRYSTGSDGLTISVTTDGTYELLVNGKSWLRSAPTFMNANNKTYSSADGSLNLQQTSGTSGTDKLGQWQTTTFSYQTTDESSISFTAAIKNYPALPLVIFEQVYNDGANWTNASNVEGICAGFPGFKVDGEKGQLGYLSYGGLMFGDTGKHMGSWDNETSAINDGITGGPLAIFDRAGNTLVFSPFNHFMSASFSHDANTGGNYYGGIMGGVTNVTVNYTQEFIIYYGTGINKAFDGWGKVLKYYYDKDPDTQHNDLTVSHLGYWTDNGAYYYYHTENNKTYEQTIYDVRMDMFHEGIPYNNFIAAIHKWYRVVQQLIYDAGDLAANRADPDQTAPSGSWLVGAALFPMYVQYDSWWYFKGKGNGVYAWLARADIFPDGFQNVATKVGLPSAGHNRYWAPDTTYAKKNGGKYDFIVEKYKSLPVTEQFWYDLLKDAKNTWNLIMYEQDWLNVEFSGMDHLLHNLTLGADWLTQMAQGADRNDIYIQYCMANPRHGMQALLYPRVTQARVSADYHPGGNQWKIGISSIFAAAMGVAPFKDTFWTTESQPGNPYDRTEPNWKLNLLVSVLSTGPVGPSDLVGATNKSMLMKCCNKDGLILKPMYPIRAIDAQIIKAALPDTHGPDGQAWVSYTNFNGLIFSNLLVVDLMNGTSYTAYPYDLGVYTQATDTGLLLAVPYDEPSGWVIFSNDTGLSFTDKFKPNRPALYHISPGIPGWSQTVVFGELDKWTPMSPQRVKSFLWSEEIIVATLQGAVGETFDFWYVLNTKLGSVMCTIDSSGSGSFEMHKSTGRAIC